MTRTLNSSELDPIRSRISFISPALTASGAFATSRRTRSTSSRNASVELAPRNSSILPHEPTLFDEVLRATALDGQARRIGAFCVRDLGQQHAGATQVIGQRNLEDSLSRLIRQPGFYWAGAL